MNCEIAMGGADVAALLIVKSSCLSISQATCSLDQAWFRCYAAIAGDLSSAPLPAYHRNQKSAVI
jgi:hypothetical protein